MLEKCKTALLLTNVPSFAERYTLLAKSIGVKLYTEEEWNARYRVSNDVVILGAKYLERLNKAYYREAVVILHKGENPTPYMQMGIEKFIFDISNEYELLLAFFKRENIVLHSDSMELKELIKTSQAKIFCFGDYNFDFGKNMFFYKGRNIYFTNGQKKYLVEWLLNSYKDNKKRMILWNLRKKFGEDFLKDVNRFGTIKEEKDEQ